MAWVHRVLEVDPERKTLVCAACGPTDAFYRKGRDRWMCGNKRREEQRAAYYARQRAKREAGVPRRRVGRAKTYLWTTYGLTEKEYNDLLDRQGHKCALCRKEKRLQVDHCHKTGKVRGLLCSSCNTGIGRLGDDVDGLKAAIAYLEGRSVRKRLGKRRAA